MKSKTLNNFCLQNCCFAQFYVFLQLYQAFLKMPSVLTEFLQGILFARTSHRMPPTATAPSLDRQNPSAEAVWDTMEMKVCQRGWAGPPRGCNPSSSLPLVCQPGLPTPHFHRQALGQPSPLKPLTFLDRPWVSPAHPNPSLYPQGRASQHLTSVGQTLRFYQSDQNP